MKGMNSTFNSAVVNKLKIYSTDSTIDEIITAIDGVTPSDSQVPTVKAVTEYIEGISAASMYTLKTVDKTIADASVAQTFGIAIPSGALLVGVALNNEVATEDDDGNDTYTAAFSGGSTIAINGGVAIAAALNTKVTEFIDINAASGITSAETDITLTPNGTNFTAGSVRAVVVYAMLNELGDA